MKNYYHHFVPDGKTKCPICGIKKLEHKHKEEEVVKYRNIKPIDYDSLQINISLIIMDAMFEFDHIFHNGRKNKVFDSDKYSKKIIKLIKKLTYRLW